ncbi:MAG: single-stranded-DNA-specific exonuclease RecJ [Eubacteriaceae bacterium]|nr:single-stranded-DNA-specific exonuclease RecJ [Eubacteriaceae bacterium]
MIIRQRGERADADAAREISNQLGIAGITASIAVSRGIKGIDEAEKFFMPDLVNLHSPYLLEGMQQAKAAINQAVKNNVKIRAVGDYDCDGVCSAAILHKMLAKLGADFSVYLPDRFTDGYGLNPQIVQKAYEDGVGMIITADNGISAVSAAALAEKYGISLVITDHHIGPEELPPADAIVNPALESSEYPFKGLCGASVAMKLSQALCDWSFSELRELVAIAAVATIADVVPLEGENRIIASLGIEYIRQGENIGLQQLVKVCKSQSALSSSFISFQLAPRINAAGRLESAGIALSLLLSESEDRAKALATALDELNLKRQQEEDSIIEAAISAIEQNGLHKQHRILFVLLEEAHEGVIGIAAGRIAEKYSRPCAVVCESSGIYKGSARSVPGIDLYSILQRAASCFTAFGGHPQAAGFSLEKESFAEAAIKANEAAEEFGLSLNPSASCFYDIEASLSQISFKSVSELEKMAPFGLGNPKPSLLIENVSLRNKKAIGKMKNHASMEAVSDGHSISVIAYNMASELTELAPHMPVDLIASAEINTFRGETSLQLDAKAIVSHISCPDDYYNSLHKLFHYSVDSQPGFYPSEYDSLPLENALSLGIKQGALFIVYGKEAFMRCIRYFAHNNTPHSIYYGELANAASDNAVLLANPIGSASVNANTAYFLDPPCFYGIDEGLLGCIRNPVFIESMPYRIQASITRTTIAHIYKHAKLVDALGGNAGEFVRFLNTKLESKIDLFSLYASLDVMAELGFLSYSSMEGKLKVSLVDSPEQKNIYSSKIMLELIGDRAIETAPQ